MDNWQNSYNVHKCEKTSPQRHDVQQQRVNKSTESRPAEFARLLAGEQAKLR